MSDPHQHGYAQQQIVDELLAGHEMSWERLDAIRAQLAVEIFGTNGWSAAPENAGDPRVNDVLDVFQAMELLDPRRPAATRKLSQGELLKYLEAMLAQKYPDRAMDLMLMMGAFKHIDDILETTPAAKFRALSEISNSAKRSRGGIACHIYAPHRRALGTGTA